MNVTPGTRLGPYEVTAAIGAGGMGEVYRARDTRLDRSVAIKVLPSHLSSNAMLRERFAREAKAISNLSHPHICALYDVGQSDGDESGDKEVYLRPFPGPGGKWQVSIGGATGAVFAPGGREIIYRKGAKFFSVPVELAPKTRIGKPQLLFEKPHREGYGDLSDDGRRILLVRDETVRTTGQIQIVMNWFDELRRRVPAP